ncbi:Replication protein A 70 kDa DNA-binding subunit [Dictyocoela muelleri]|nr:Replication protein A 70 kDa DNA-binding subunit [Dictyocoela muelleri]
MILKSGTIECIMNNKRENPLYQTPILQIISLKRIDLGENKGSRYHVILSDGQHYVKGIFSSACTKPFETKLINTLSLVRLESFRVCEKNGTNFLYISAIEEFEDCNRKIGNPVKFGDVDSSYFESPKSAQTNRNEMTEPTKQNYDFKENQDKIQITPIITINPFLNRWTIQGTLTSKGDIRYYTNQKGDGKLFHAEITDHSGSIRIVGFGEVVDIFYNLLEVGKVYSVSKGNIRLGNKKFLNTTSEYEITLDKNSEIKLVADVGVGELSYNFQKIEEIKTPQALIDVICVVKEAYPPNSVLVRTTQKEILKRDLIVCDKTSTIRLTVWGPQVELDYEDNPVIAIKNVRVGEYNGFTLSTISSSQIQINPERKEAFELKGWFLEHGNEIKMPKREEVPKSIGDVNENALEYSTVRAILLFIKDENLWYDACPETNCNKKVFNENGSYRCERCNKTYDECNSRFLVRASIGDQSGQIWVTLFNETAQKLFEKSAEEMKIISQEESISEILKQYTFKEYLFKLRRREEIYNDEARARFSVLDIFPLDHKSESLRLLKEIRKSARVL